jgi:PHP family Zn ribbon phosphoesterase
VENRVVDLAQKIIDKKSLLFVKNQSGVTFVYDQEKKRRPFVSLIPLLEVLLEINNNSPAKALAEYERLVTTFAPEFEILLRKSYEQIETAGGKNFVGPLRLFAIDRSLSIRDMTASLAK